MLTARLEILDLTLRDPFIIARPGGDPGRATTVIVEIRDDRYPGFVGTGEGFPDAHYGETPGTIREVVPLLLEAVGDPQLTLAGLAQAADAMVRRIGHQGAAKCAVDIALHDLAARVAGMPLVAFLGLGTPLPPTDFTLGIDEPAIVAERAMHAAHFPALKIKVGGPDDLATLRAVRRVYPGSLRIDANAGWDLETALRHLPEVERLGVELIEQPFPAHQFDQLARLQAATSIPIVADESAVTIDDLAGLVGVVDGVNVKLAKCGGVGPAKQMLERARALGLKTFLGCRQETSVGIAASAALATLADWVDLDGSLLLADDPFEGLDLASDARWILPDSPGSGVRRRATSGAESTNALEGIGAKGLVWAGVKTERSAAMRTFVRDVLGVRMVVDDPEMAIFQLPDTSLFEVLGAGWNDEVGYPNGPVLGFWVDDVSGARRALLESGVELAGPTFKEGEHRWQHFRGPDGNLYQVASGPYRSAANDV